MSWLPMNTAPKGEDVLVWYEHAADPYQDPHNPGKLTSYAAWAENGDFLDGGGITIAKWHPPHFESEDDYGNGYWLPEAWFALENGDYERVCNPTHWQPLPAPPLPASFSTPR